MPHGPDGKFITPGGARGASSGGSGGSSAGSDITKKPGYVSPDKKVGPIAERHFKGTGSKPTVKKIQGGFEVSHENGTKVKSFAAKMKKQYGFQTSVSTKGRPTARIMGHGAQYASVTGPTKIASS